MKQRRPRWKQEEAPLLAASAPAQTRSRHPFFKVPYRGRKGGAEATKNDIQCQRLHSKASGAWGMHCRQGRAAVCPAGRAAVLGVICRFDISEVVIGVATFETGLGNCRLIYDCRAPR